jgi:O-antigen/teichoic acid export membrane protein
MSSLRKKAIQGTIWTIAGYGASQVLRLGSNLILTRLLLPEFFGLMALVNVFIIGLNLFSDVGLGPSIIQNKRGDDPDFLNTAWTIQVMRGVVLWLGSLLIAWPISHFYAKPELLWLIPIVGLATLISGFDSTALLTLNRQLAVGKLAIFELMGQVISLIVMIVWAKFDPSIRALVAGTFVSAVFQLLWSHRLLPHQPNRFAWDKEAAQKIFTFGKWIFFSTALTFLASQADRLILGKLISAALLGIYGIAYTFADIPRSVILALSGKVIFPTFAKLVGLPRETFRTKILKNRKLLLLALAAGLSILVGFGDYVIYFLYKKEYHQAAWMLPIIALGIWHTSLYSTMSPALLALGKPIYNTLGYLFTLITITIGLLVGYHSMKMPGAVIAVAVGDFPFYMVTMYGLWREKLGCLKQDLWATALFLSLLAAVLVVRVSLLHLGLPIDSMFKLN